MTNWDDRSAEASDTDLETDAEQQADSFGTYVEGFGGDAERRAEDLGYVEDSGGGVQLQPEDVGYVEDSSSGDAEQRADDGWGAAATNKFAEIDQRHTRYDDRSTLADRAADTDDEGRVVGPDGAWMSGTYGWVIDDETGYLLFLPPDQIVVHFPDRPDEYLTREEFHNRRADLRALGATYEKIHHTTPVAGMPVTGAGLVELNQGWIVRITDESGHYQPTAHNQYNSLVALEGEGYSLERPVSAADSPDGVEGYRGTTVSLTGSVGTGGRPTSKAQWLQEERAKNPYIPIGDLELKWEQFQQTGGDELVARRRAALNAEFLAQQQQTAPAAQAAPNAGASVYLNEVPPTDPNAQSDSGDTPYLNVEAPQTDPNAVRTVYRNLAALQTDPNFEFDTRNGLYRNVATNDYYSGETGEVVYVFDTASGQYLDPDGNPV